MTKTRITYGQESTDDDKLTKTTIIIRTRVDKC